jgi:hypothetical protein
MFHYFGILTPSSTQDDEILASGIETPVNVIRQKRFFGGATAQRPKRVEYDLTAHDGVDPDFIDTSNEPMRFVSMFISPYV